MPISTSKAPRQLSDGNSQGTILGDSPTDLIGFYGVSTGVPQATPTGNTHTVAAGSTTAVYTNTTFDGGIGSTAFTMGDLVAILKTAGLLKA